MKMFMALQDAKFRNPIKYGSSEIVNLWNFSRCDLKKILAPMWLFSVTRGCFSMQPSLQLFCSQVILYTQQTGFGCFFFQRFFPSYKMHSLTCKIAAFLFPIFLSINYMIIFNSTSFFFSKRKFENEKKCKMKLSLKKKA